MHVQKYDAKLDYDSAVKLRNSAEAIWKARADDPPMKTENILDLLHVAAKIADKKVYCEKERTWIFLTEPACSLWRPRGVECTS